MTTALSALVRSSVVHVAFAFLAMGAWASFANRSAGSGHALIAGVVQGALSGGITLVLKRFLETASARLSGVWAVVAPPTISCVVILAVLVGAHLVAGTRNVLATISLPYAISSTYAWVYSWAMTRGTDSGDDSVSDLENRRPIKARDTGWARGLAARLAKARAKPNLISATSVALAVLGGA